MRLPLLASSACIAAMALHSAAQDPAAPAQPPAGDPPIAATAKKTAELFRTFRDSYSEGQFEVAGELLKNFLAANPTDEELLALEAKYGATFNLKLRNVDKWSDNPTVNADVKKAVETLISKTAAATAKISKDPKRILNAVRNLGGSPEVSLYAIDQLRKAGDAAVPTLVETLRATRDVPQQTGILAAITKLDSSTIQPFLAAAEALPDNLKEGIIRAIANRVDVLSLSTRADTDLTPILWYLADLPKGGSGSTIRDTSRNLLTQIVGSIDKANSAVELTRLARVLTTKKAIFAGTDGQTNRVKVWTWDPATQNVKANDFSSDQAQEYYAIRNLRWATERDPSNDTAQNLFLGFVTERAVERARFAPLSTANPATFSLLASAPAALLIELLEDALREKRTALAVGLTQVLGDRAEKAATEPTVRANGELRPSVLARALDYPDDRVQLAAAVAIVNTPSTRPHGSGPRVVDVLRRALGSADAGPEGNKGKAIVVDPSAYRASRVAGMLREVGYTVETVNSNRELIRRVRESADVDLFLIDHHAANPTLSDALAALRSDASGGRPVLVLASSDITQNVPLESKLLRLALLVAITETDLIEIPPSYTNDPRRDEESNAQSKREIVTLRDKRIQLVFDSRLARLKRLVDAAELPPSKNLDERLELRLPQLTYAIIAAEHSLTLDTAPNAAKRYEMYSKVVKTRTELDAVVATTNSTKINTLIEHLEKVLTPELSKKFEALRVRIDTDGMKISLAVSRDPILEGTLANRVRTFNGVRVISEPYSIAGLTDDLRLAIADPADLPRSPAEKTASAKKAAEALRAMALGVAPGYDVRPAEAAMRAALRNDDLAPILADAVAKISSAEAQQDLLNTALGSTRPTALRTQAADATVRHIRQFGPFANAAQKAALTTAANTEANLEVKARLAVLNAQYSGKSGDLAKALVGYNPMQIEPLPAPKPAPDKTTPMPMEDNKPMEEKKPGESEKK